MRSAYHSTKKRHAKSDKTMKKFFICLIAMIASLSVDAQKDQNDWANYGRFRDANATAPRHAPAVFMGNSIVEGWVRTDPAFFSDNNYIGRGISGQVTAQMLARFRADVLALQPKSVVILAGTNDIAMNNGYVALEDIAGNIESMVELAQAHGIRAIICSVLPAYDYAWRPGLEPADKIIRLNEMLKKYADKNDIPYVDYHSAMKDERNGLSEQLAGDGVHPTLEGYKIMEQLIKPVIESSTAGKTSEKSAKK